MADAEELAVPGSVSLADEERDKIEALEEIVVGDHVKQEILVRAGDSEAIARRLGQRTQASVTYPAEEEDAKNIADEDIFDLDEELKEERERLAEESATQQVMEAHEEAKEESDEEKLPSTHAALDELAAEKGVDLSDATTVAEKQEAIQAAG